MTPVLKELKRKFNNIRFTFMFLLNFFMVILIAMSPYLIMQIFCVWMYKIKISLLKKLSLCKTVSIYNMVASYFSNCKRVAFTLLHLFMVKLQLFYKYLTSPLKDHLQLIFLLYYLLAIAFLQSFLFKRH